MKVKDLPSSSNMGEVKVKTLEGKVGYWKSQWEKGVWLSDGKTGRMYPQFLENLKECLEWEVVDEKEPINL